MPASLPLLSTIEGYVLSQGMCSEHQLIRYLQLSNLAPFNQLNLQHPKELFCAHFLVKHCLYTLQDNLIHTERCFLRITATKITVEPFSKGQNGLQPFDKLKAYYLDISHYFETSEREINTLLRSFWQRYLVRDDKQRALKTLGLNSDADYPAIKQAYRRLAQATHPDKGGDSKEFIKLAAAKALLDTLYNSAAKEEFSQIS